MPCRGALFLKLPLRNRNYLMNDQKVITLFKQGDREKAFRILYQLYPRIERMVLSYGSQKADVLDVFQESLIIVYNNLMFNETDEPQTLSVAQLKSFF